MCSYVPIPIYMYSCTPEVSLNSIETPSLHQAHVSPGRSVHTATVHAVCGPESAVQGDWAYAFEGCQAQPLEDFMLGGTAADCDAACEAFGADYCAIIDDNSSCWGYIDGTAGACIPGDELLGWTKWVMCSALPAFYTACTCARAASTSLQLTGEGRAHQICLHATRACAHIKQRTIF